MRPQVGMRDMGSRPGAMARQLGALSVLALVVVAVTAVTGRVLSTAVSDTVVATNSVHAIGDAVAAPAVYSTRNTHAIAPGLSPYESQTESFGATTQSTTTQSTVARSTETQSTETKSLQQAEPRLRGLYNLALIEHGRTFSVAVIGYRENVSPSLTLLTDLVRGALGRLDVSLQLIARTDNTDTITTTPSPTTWTERADLVLLGSDAAAVAEAVAYLAPGSSRRSVVIAVDASAAVSDASDAAFIRSSTGSTRGGTINGSYNVRTGNETDIAADSVLASTADQLAALLSDSNACSAASTTADDAGRGRYRGGGGDAWCAAARRLVVAAWVRALHRWDVPASGRAFFMTYGTAPQYDVRLNHTWRGAIESGAFTEAYRLTQYEIDSEFQRLHAAVLSAPRGGGYWLWKPYFVLRILRDTLSPGDVLLYSDCGNTFKSTPLPYLVAAGDAGVLAFLMPRQPMAAWTKGLVFAALDMDLDSYGQMPQATATAFALRRDPFSLFLVSQWLHYCSDAALLTDEPDPPTVARPPGFQDHRHDQSLLSLLLRKYGARGVRPTDETYRTGPQRTDNPQILDRSNRHWLPIGDQPAA